MLIKILTWRVLSSFLCFFFAFNFQINNLNNLINLRGREESVILGRVCHLFVVILLSRCVWFLLSSFNCSIAEMAWIVCYFEVFFSYQNWFFSHFAPGRVVKLAKLPHLTLPFETSSRGIFDQGASRIFVSRRKVEIFGLEWKWLRFERNLVLLSGVGQLLGVDGSSEGTMGLIVRVRVVWWVCDNLVRSWVLVFQEFLQTDDSWQDEGQLSDDQSLEGDQSEESDGEWQEGGGLQFSQDEEWQQVFLALLSLAASCQNESREKRLITVTKRAFCCFKVFHE